MFVFFCVLEPNTPTIDPLTYEITSPLVTRTASERTLKLVSPTEEKKTMRTSGENAALDSILNYEGEEPEDGNLEASLV